MRLTKQFPLLAFLFPFLFISSFIHAADTIDIVTYNTEWLGNPSTAGYNGTRTQQINAAANDIINGGGEIYALQEVGGSSALNDLISALNVQDNQNSWSGGVSQPTASQSLAFVYKTNVVSGVSFQTILTNESSYNFAGRYPYLMTANVNVGASSAQLILIDLHLKCCTGSTNANRRAAAMASLVAELDNNYRTDNVIVLGDLNVAQEGGANGEIADWGFYNDQDNDGKSDYSHAAGSVADTAYDPSSTLSDIDHILISDELKSTWDAVSSGVRNQYLNTTMSDHSPVKTTLDLSQLGLSSGPGGSNGGGNTSSVSEALAATVGTHLSVTGEIVDYFNTQYAMVIRDLSNSNEIIVKLEADQRSQWSPYLNPSVIGTVVEVDGQRDAYSGQASIESVSNIEAVSGASGSSNADSVSQALAASIGTELTFIGEIVDDFNTQYAMVLRDLSNSNEIVVKLESNQRSTWSPYLNPSVLGTIVEVTGTRDTYSGQPSVEQASNIVNAN